MKLKNIFFILIAAMVAVFSFSSYAVTDSELIAGSKKTISEKKKELESAKEKQAEHDKKAEELKSLKADTAAYIEGIDSEILLLGTELSGIEEDIQSTQEAVTILEGELSELLAQKEEQYNSMKLLIKAAYENSKTSELSEFLSAGSIADILNRSEYIKKTGDYDRKKLEEFETLVLETREKEKELNEALDILNEEKEALSAKKSSLDSLKAEKEKELASYDEKIKSEENESQKLASDVKTLKAAITAEENQIKKIEEELKRKEEEARKKALAEGKKYTVQSLGEISFTWPCPSSSRITSEFGAREAPVSGASTNHKGIDIGASTGSDVLAAALGEVVISTYSASAGNYVMISHGGNVYTVYMHMDTVKVSVGDSVQKGSKIGTVGSTGYSTGPHLHFGLRVDGEYVNPLNYVAP